VLTGREAGNRLGSVEGEVRHPPATLVGVGHRPVADRPSCAAVDEFVTHYLAGLSPRRFLLWATDPPSPGPAGRRFGIRPFIRSSRPFDREVLDQRPCGCSAPAGRSELTTSSSPPSSGRTRRTHACGRRARLDLKHFRSSTRGCPTARRLHGRHPADHSTASHGPSTRNSSWSALARRPDGRGSLTEQAARVSSRMRGPASTSSSRAARKPSRPRSERPVRGAPRPASASSRRGGVRAGSRPATTRRHAGPGRPTSRAPATSRCGACGKALRMRPTRADRPVRFAQEECLDMFDIANSRLPAMCTLHANSARKPLVNMWPLPLRGRENVPARSSCRPSAAIVDHRRAPDRCPWPGNAACANRRRTGPRRGRHHHDVRRSSTSRSCRLDRAAATRRILPFERLHRPLSPSSTIGRAPRRASRVGEGYWATLWGLMLACGFCYWIWLQRSRAPQRLATVPCELDPPRTDLLRQAGVDGVGRDPTARRAGLCALGRRAFLVGDDVQLAVRSCLRRVRPSSVPLQRLSACSTPSRSHCANYGPSGRHLAPAVTAGYVRCRRIVATRAAGGPANRCARPCPGGGFFTPPTRARGRVGECLDALTDDLADPVVSGHLETIGRPLGRGSDLGTCATLVLVAALGCPNPCRLETRQGRV